MNQAPPDGSVTVWIQLLKAGDPAAAKPLWDGYFDRLVRLARERLGGVPRAVADAEDVALSAFNSLCTAAAAGRFPRLDDRDDLWQVLFMLTARKAVGLIRHDACEKRVPPSHAPTAPASDSTPDALAAAVAAGPSPDEVAEVTEACGRLLGLLGEGNLRSVAVWKMEGYTNAEIARELKKSVPTVERKLADIRKIWKREGGR